MNIIFSVSLISSLILILFFSPEQAVAAMQQGAESAVKLCLTLAAVYTVWMGIFSLMEKCGLTRTLARLLKKPLKLIFGDLKDAEEDAVINVSANLLGLGGIATPSGIKAISAFDKADNHYGKAMLFVLSATGFQIIPTSVISLRSSLGSVSASDIIIPTLLSGLVSTVCGILLVKIFVKK